MLSAVEGNYVPGGKHQQPTARFICHLQADCGENEISSRFNSLIDYRTAFIFLT